VNETALLFGPRKALVGILTNPATGAPPGERPGVLILNAGLLHRVGPNRVHVQMARFLAERGFAVLRFDLSGIGDSRPREGVVTIADSVMEDTREALDLMERMTGLRRFLLIGICSGADIALFAATQEPRVVGAALIDGYFAPTFGFRVGRQLRRVFTLRSWLRLLTGQSQVWSVVVDALAAPRRRERSEPRGRGPRFSPVAKYRESVRVAVTRGVALLLVYTEDGPSLYHYRRSMKKQIPRWAARQPVSVEYFDGSDHVFTLRVNQERIVRILSHWASTVLPEPRGVADGPSEEGRPG